MRKLMLAAAVGLVLVACGGGGDDGISFRDPDDVSFSFGTPVAVAAGPEQWAANDGEWAGTSMVNLGTADETVMQELADFVVTSPETLSAIFDPAPPDSRSGALFYPGERTWIDPECVSVTPQAQLAFDHCRQTLTEGEGEYVWTLNGSIIVDVGHIQWNLTSTWSLSVGGEAPSDQDTSHHFTGSIDVSTVDQTIAGFARSNFYRRASDADDEAITYNVDYDLEYDTVPDLCVTGGNLTLKRLYSLPAGDPDYEDAAVQLSWDGCDNALAAWPVEPAP